MIVGRGGEERESTSARVVVGNACCACVLAGAVCMLGRSTSYSIRGVIHEYVRCSNVKCRVVCLIRGIVCEGRGAVRGAFRFVLP